MRLRTTIADRRPAPGLHASGVRLYRAGMNGPSLSIFALALACALAACATSPRVAWQPGERVRWSLHQGQRHMQLGDTSCREDDAPGVRQRIVAAAASQWRLFGYPVSDFTSNPATRVPADEGAPIIPPELNAQLAPEQRQRAMLRLGLMEDDPRAMLAIGEYWSVTAPHEVARQNRLWAIEPAAGWAAPWSAAFVSWTMCEAGLSAEAFPRASAHIRYIDYAYRATEHSAYRYETNGQGAIDPGDLICAWRGPGHLLDLEQGRAGNAATHCDIVVRVDHDRKRLYAIGGNVVQAVTLSILGFEAEDNRMRLETPPEHPGAPRWFAVLRLRAPGAGEADFSAALSRAAP